MFENIINFFKKLRKAENDNDDNKVNNKKEKVVHTKDTAKERLHLVLMQDRANMSADFLELMRKEIIDVIRKYIEIDEALIDVRLTNKTEEDGTVGAPFLYANIPVIKVKNEKETNGPKKKQGTTIKKVNGETQKKESKETPKKGTEKKEDVGDGALGVPKVEKKAPAKKSAVKKEGSKKTNNAKKG